MTRFISIYQMIQPNIGSDMYYIGPVLGYPGEAYLMYWDNTKTNIAVKKWVLILGEQHTIFI